MTTTKEVATEQLRSLREDIVSGQAKFEDFASRFFDCSSAKRGGDLGPFGRGQRQKPFEEATYALKVGEVSDVVETDNGVHIILRTTRWFGPEAPHCCLSKFQPFLSQTEGSIQMNFITDLIQQPFYGRLMTNPSVSLLPCCLFLLEFLFMTQVRVIGTVFNTTLFACQWTWLSILWVLLSHMGELFT